MADAGLSVDAYDGTGDDWNAALTGMDGASFCHRFGWKGVMEAALGHETFYRVARTPEGEIRGLLPMVRVKSHLFGDYLVSMPFLNYGGPAGSVEARRALASEAGALAERLGVDLLELRGRIELPDTELTLNQRKVTVIKELPSDPEELWEKGLRSKLRSQVRRPMKEGMEIRFGNDLLDPFYDIFARTMRDLGTPVLPRRFFEEIRTRMPEGAVFAVVYLETEPVAAGCASIWGDELEITWAGSSREHQRMAPNMLLYWGLMEETARRGLRFFNFGRCSPDSGTHRFKKQWGTEDHPLPWLHWSASGVPSTPNPDSPKFRLATSIWQKLPVGVTNVVGPRLSRLIP